MPFALTHGESGNVAGDIRHREHVLIFDQIARDHTDGLRQVPQNCLGLRRGRALRRRVARRFYDNLVDDT